LGLLGVGVAWLHHGLASAWFGVGLALGDAIYFPRPRGWQQWEADEQYAFERGFGMLTLLYGRQLVGIHCAGAVRDGIEQ